MFFHVSSSTSRCRGTDICEQMWEVKGKKTQGKVLHEKSTWKCCLSTVQKCVHMCCLPLRGQGLYCGSDRQTWLVRRLQWWATAKDVSMNISGMDVRSSMLWIFSPNRCRSKACPWIAYETIKDTQRHYSSHLLSDPSSVNVKREYLRYTCWSDVSGWSSGAAPASLCSELGAV